MFYNAFMILSHIFVELTDISHPIAGWNKAGKSAALRMLERLNIPPSRLFFILLYLLDAYTSHTVIGAAMR